MVPAPEMPSDVGALLLKAGTYVVGYEPAFRNVAAEERYEQKTSLVSNDPRGGRQPGDGPQPNERMRSEVVFTMLPGAVPGPSCVTSWELDGRVLREAGRLEPLFRRSPSAGLREAEAIARESERLMLGPTTRTLNVPTMALAYLHPDNQDAFRFRRKGRAQVGGQETVEIAFEEVARPTLNQDGAGADVPLRGRFWVRESDGAVVRSRTELAFAAAGATQGSMGDTVGAPQGRVAVTTEYGKDPGLGLLAPLEMVETLEWRTEQARRVTERGTRARRRRLRHHRGPGALLRLPSPRPRGQAGDAVKLDGGRLATGLEKGPQRLGCAPRLPANSRSTSQTCGCVFAISSRVGRSSSSSSQRVRATMLAMRGWPVRIEISPKKAPSFRSPRGFCRPVTTSFRNTRTRPEVSVEAVTRLALPQDRLAALEAQELQALDHRHHLVHGEVAEERAHHDLVPPGRSAPRSGDGRRGRSGARELLEDAVHEAHQFVGELPRRHRLGGRSLLYDLHRGERHVDLVFLLASVQEVVVLDPLVGSRPDESRGRSVLQPRREQR